MLVNLSKREIEQIVNALDEQECGLQSSEDIRLHLCDRLSKLIDACECQAQKQQEDIN